MSDPTGDLVVAGRNPHDHHTTSVIGRTKYMGETAMDTYATWQPLAAPYDINDNGKLDPRERRALPDSAFALPHQRELPLVDAELTLEAIAELRTLKGVTEEERSVATTNIRAAARFFGIEMR
jgi:hypothetical protein